LQLQLTHSYRVEMSRERRDATVRQLYTFCLLVGLLAFEHTTFAAAPPVGQPAAAGAASGHAFVVFDGLLFKPMPDLRERGMPKLLGLGNVWRKGVSKDMVDAPAVQDTARFLRRFTDTYYLDIENWLRADESDAEIRADVTKFVQVAHLARAAAPDAKFGFYGVAPIRTYWPIVAKSPDRLAAWRHLNELSAPIAANTDYVFPSLYTFYEDPAGWELAAREILKEARRYGKPVYPFLWFEYHNSNSKLVGKQIPREVWRRELEICYENADGVVLWGGPGQKWDEQAGWWQATLEFMQTLPKRPAHPTDVHARQ
jgi:hypothetical protein